MSLLLETKLLKLLNMIRNNYKSYLDRAGYYDFMKRYGIGDNYFEIHGTNYYIDNDYNVKYYCESKQYSLYPYTLYINNLNKYSLEQYDIRYKDGNLIKIEKHEYSNEDNTATESKKSVPKKTPTKKSSSNTTTEKSHDPDDYDIDTYYEDYKDEFYDEDDAYDDFEDNELWDEY